MKNIKEKIIEKLIEKGYLPDEVERALPSDEMLDLIIEAILSNLQNLTK